MFVLHEGDQRQAMDRGLVGARRGHGCAGGRRRPTLRIIVLLIAALGIVQLYIHILTTVARPRR
jgi:hypothetical protein